VPVRLELLEIIPKFAAQNWIDARGRFVQEDELRLVHNGRRQAQTALHPARQMAHVFVFVARQLHQLQQVIQALVAAQRHAIERGGKIEVLPHAQVLVKHKLLRHIANFGPVGPAKLLW
jgi:hypothetical protein